MWPKNLSKQMDDSDEEEEKISDVKLPTNQENKKKLAMTKNLA